MLALVIVAVAGLLYVRFVRYERVAARHVPAGATAALRLEVQQAALYEPFRKHLLPLLGGPSLPPAEGDARVAVFERRSGLSRADLREVLVALGPGERDWAIVVGGIFRRHLDAALLSDSLGAADARWRPAGGGLVQYGDTGMTAAAAPDGTVIFGSSARVVDATISPAAPGLALSPGAGGLVVTRSVLEGRPGGTGTGSGPSGALREVFRGLSSLKGQIEIGERVELMLHPITADAAAARAAAVQGFDILRSFGRSDASALGRTLRVGAERGRVIAEAPDGPAVVLVWEREELDRAFEAAADWIREVGLVPAG